MILHILDYTANTIRIQNVFSFGYVNSQTKQPNKEKKMWTSTTSQFQMYFCKNSLFFVTALITKLDLSSECIFLFGDVTRSCSRSQKSRGEWT